MEEEDGRVGRKERNVKFLITMNMPSGQGYAVHQITVDHPSQNCEEFWRVLNDEIFILGRQFYRKKLGPVAEPVWEDRGEIIINTAHVGKVQEFIEYGKGYEDEAYRSPENSRTHVERTRPPIRPGRGVL
jgi:hypothetical protein